jgi:hypothetical protein
MQTVLPPPQVNYVALYPMPSPTDEDEPLIIRLVSYDLDMVVDIVKYSIGLLEPNLFSLITTLYIYSFQSVSLMSNEDILESMTEFCPLTWCPSRALSSWNP